MNVLRMIKLFAWETKIEAQIYEKRKGEMPQRLAMHDDTGRLNYVTVIQRGTTVHPEQRDHRYR